MQQSAHSQSCNSPRALFNNLTWAGGSKIALYRHVFPLSLWCSLEIRPDHPCWHCVLALHEMHTIMQIELEVIKPCSSLKNPHSPCSILSPSPHSDSALMGCGENPQFWMAATATLVLLAHTCNQRNTERPAGQGALSKRRRLTQTLVFYQQYIVFLE